MILIVCAFLAVMTVPLSGQRLSRMSTLPIRHMWMVWVAIGIQTILVSVVHPPENVGRVAHLASYAVVGLFAVSNWRIPGVPLISIGGLLNLIAIVANGGVMPASAWALRTAGIIDDTEFSNSMFVEGARMRWFGDIFAVPESWPLSNVFSVGDIVVVIGIGYLAHRHCRTVEAASELERDTADLAV
jgi:hypothetical protein